MPRRLWGSLGTKTYKRQNVAVRRLLKDNVVIGRPASQRSRPVSINLVLLACRARKVVARPFIRNMNPFVCSCIPLLLPDELPIGERGSSHLFPLLSALLSSDGFFAKLAMQRGG
ncbi:hypothetical protein J3458_003088 [Metarhizium acridum]|uniref:uncharacterized protein n=1 Tax=Metarhizium acridum TaxID=92637 RepID=UPI001C6CF599|nr:hypothetical protein J3458_003088 [Metarhizium acridum]